jgi:putative ABC transport system ATP-binding protein
VKASAGAEAQTSGDPDIVLEARGLHRFYERGDEEVAALRDVSLTARRGEFLAVMGPSGSGKSTLMSLLAGLDRPDGGNVYIRGQRVSRLTNQAGAIARGCCIGVLTQQSGLLDHLSVLQNVQLAAAMRRRARRSRFARATWRDETLLGRSAPFSCDAVLQSVGLEPRAGARPSTLSGGETARANLAVALAEHPLVLLADEPTAEVSTDEEEALLQVLAQVCPPEGVVVVVTHSPRVARHADRVIELVDGRQV